MITQWTIRRIGPIATNAAASWAILKDDPDGRPQIVRSAGNLNRPFEEFGDLVLNEFDDIKKEVTEA
jgi:hypothetical protein